MPVDPGLLYGEMAGSLLVHLAIPVGVAVLLSVLPYMELNRKVLLLVVITALISGLVQFGFITALQASSCSGVKDYQTIFTAAGVCALITGAMTALPAYVEPLRLTVSQLFGAHKSMLSPALSRINTVISDAGTELAAAAMDKEVVQKGGAALTEPEYEAQVFRETMIGAAYWSAFAGAYGIGIGSMIATKCPASG
jgi:hypothetical protein